MRNMAEKGLKGGRETGQQNLTWQESRFLGHGRVEARRCICLKKWVPISKIKNKNFGRKPAFSSIVSASPQVTEEL
jgi:hypothetical protein